MHYLSINRAPRKWPMVLSAIAHFAIGALVAGLVMLERSRPVIVSPAKTESVQALSVDRVTLPPAKGARMAAPQKKARAVARKMPAIGDGSKEGIAAIRAEARRQTVALVQNFKFRTVYGFSPFPRYELPFQISGEMPVISANELPPRFEQYLIVEVTIDNQGKVVDARLTAGQADPKITDKVLAAIRQFKYRPATREGAPIPTQTDIVVHIPT